jgi:multiple sugar transport system permease protein
MMKSNVLTLKKGLLYLILLGFALITIFPYFWSLSTSLKASDEVFAIPSKWFPTQLHFENYSYVWTSVPFGRYMLNTLLVAIVSVLGQVIFGSLSAYAFARMDFKGKHFLFGLFLSTLMIPGVVTLIPLFILMKYLGWLNSYYALIAPVVLGTPYGIFLLRQFFLGIPKDLEEAATLDGAGRLLIFIKVILPSSRPVIATLAVTTFVTAWNNFVWPLIVTDSDNLRLISLGITSFKGQYNTQWNYMMAASIIALIPLLIMFLFFQKQIVNSIQLTGLK